MNPEDTGSLVPTGGVYRPSPEDEAKISDTIEKRGRWREDRQVHEQEWFINVAMTRGNQYVEWSDRLQRLQVPKAPPHRVRLKINRIQGKVRSRLAKFLKNRPKPIVVPATEEYQDYLDAKATQRVLDYQWRRVGLEQKLKDVLLWAMMCGKGFWWYHWKPNVKARIQTVDPKTKLVSYEDQELGDVDVEVGSAFELLVADPGVSHLAKQPEIMRLKMRKVADLQARYPDFAPLIVANQNEESLFTYERQIAGLNSYTYTTSAKKKDTKDEVLVTEHFLAPSPLNEMQGEYRVLVGEILVKSEPLPYDFADLENPYPCTEFTDADVPGQFWTPTVVSQLVDLQREYNLIRSKIAENIRVMAHPKIFVAKQHQIQKSAWTSEAGEIIEYVAIPNLQPPTPWSPQNVAADLWQAIQLLQKEFDDVSQLYPAAEGKASGQTSGFQTNLLQEATESVHGPDIRAMELSVEEGLRKIRRMVKLGYTAPRLLAVSGSNFVPEVFEFVNDRIDEMADVVVEAGSALPTLKAAKQDAVMNIFKSGLMGNPQDPEVRRRTLAMLEMGSLEEAFDTAKADENQARLENKEIGEGQPLDPACPHFWENHQVHYAFHTQMLKSPEIRNWNPALVRVLTAHTILHARFINPQSALQIAQQEGIQEVMPAIMAMLPPPMAPGAPAPGPQGPGAPPQAGAQPAAQA